MYWLQGFTFRHGEKLWRSPREKSHHSSVPNSFSGTGEKLGPEVIPDQLGQRPHCTKMLLGFYLKIKGVGFRVEGLGFRGSPAVVRGGLEMF